jgi:hypothetical protein
MIDENGQFSAERRPEPQFTIDARHEALCVGERLRYQSMGPR